MFNHETDVSLSKAKETEFKESVCLVKAQDHELGIVYGWGTVCEVDGQPYIDHDNDHLPYQSMLKAAASFMEGDRKVMIEHKEDEGGKVLFAFPLDGEKLNKAFGIECNQTGLMIGMKPAKQETYNKFKSGELTGFSIGGAIDLTATEMVEM